MKEYILASRRKNGSSLQLEAGLYPEQDPESREVPSELTLKNKEDWPWISS